MSRRFVRVALAVALFGASVAAQAQTEIQWWHSMTGAHNDRVNEFAKRLQREPEGLQGRARLQGHATPSR